MGNMVGGFEPRPNWKLAEAEVRFWTATSGGGDGRHNTWQGAWRLQGSRYSGQRNQWATRYWFSISLFQGLVMVVTESQVE